MKRISGPGQILSAMLMKFRMLDERRPAKEIEKRSDCYGQFGHLKSEMKYGGNGDGFIRTNLELLGEGRT